MQAIKLLSIVTTLSLCIPAVLAADPETCKLPKPTAAHDWLQQTVGEWQTTTEATYEPGKPPVVTKGQEKVTSLGGFWTVDEVQGDMMGKPFKGVMTLGYDDAKKQYVGTWIDSNTGKLWTYTGQVKGQTLTLESEGECPMNPGKQMKFKEVIEIKSPDHRVFTSSVNMDGKWFTSMVSHAHRVK
jgi:hypothetical protein